MSENPQRRVSNSVKAKVPLRILVADDNPALRTSLGNMLASSHDGWVICAEAENGRQAVSKAIDLRPDVVVLDLSMPVMDGLEAAREIANVFASIPIFLYTLHVIPALEQEAAKFGIKQVVCKPNWQSLFDAIESTTKHDGENPEPPTPVIRSRAFMPS
jgi:CheY-like chemotaxis protein